MRIKVIAAYLNNVKRRRRRLAEATPTDEAPLVWDAEDGTPAALSWDDEAGVDTPLVWST